jgi:tRNA G18 (ribose-2'-O)-methylase SpoU
MKPVFRTSPPPVEETEILYGLHSGMAVFERRREDIRQVSFEGGVRAEIQELLRWAASARVPCRELDEKELANRSQSNQHEGLVLGVRPRRWLPPKELGSWLVTQQGSAVALDRVRNPQNIGAIIRSAAFFGIGAAILGAPAPHPGLPPLALRVAEGGAEHLLFSRTTDLADSLSRLKASGVHVLGADSHASGDGLNLPYHAPCVLVLGNEREGLSPRVKAQCSELVGVRGSGALDSLNVAVAAGVLFAALWRSRPQPGATQTVEHRR